MRPSWEIAPYFAFVDVHYVLRQSPISLTIAKNGQGCVSAEAAVAASALTHPLN